MHTFEIVDMANSSPFCDVSGNLIIISPFRQKIAEFGLSIKSPNESFNFVELNGTISIKNYDISFQTLKIIVTCRNTLLENSSEIDVYSTEQNLLPANLLEKEYSSSTTNIGFNFSMGGINDIIFPSYYAFALYIQALNEVSVDTTKQPIVYGQIIFTGTSYMKKNI